MGAFGHEPNLLYDNAIREVRVSREGGRLARNRIPVKHESRLYVLSR